MTELDFFKNPPLVWFITGLVFAFLELMVPGLVLLFFGIGAWLTSIVCLIFKVSIGIQILVFSVTTVVSLAVLRKFFKKHLYQKNKNSEGTLEDDFIGNTATAETDISPDSEGKIIFKGALWKARSSEYITINQRVEIVGKDSITLIIKPIKK